MNQTAHVKTTEGRLSIEVHPNDECTFSVHRSTDCLWLDVIAGRTELTLFIDPAKAVTLAAELARRADEALRVKNAVVDASR